MATTNFYTSLLMLVLVLFSLLISSSATISPHGTNLAQSRFLDVPDSEFAASLQSIVNDLNNVTSMVTRLLKVAYLNNDAHLSMTFRDCLEWLDSSSESLTQSLTLVENPTGNNNDQIMGTGDFYSDIRTWLSAAVTYQDTCIEGFDGTDDNIFKKTLAEKINQIKPSIQQLLSQLNHASVNFKAGSKFPPWIRDKDIQFIHSSSYNVTPNLTVALDGTGDYSTVTKAVSAAPTRCESRYVIYVKKGVYREHVEINSKHCPIMIIGDGIDSTIISGDRNCVDPPHWKTYRTATLAVKGSKFIARDMTIENTAGPRKAQAVALISDSDMSIFFRCKITGYQDTLYPHSNRQFYRECVISGTVDFIFGRGTVVFQNCTVLARKPLQNQQNTITAQGREFAACVSGFIFQFCNISADADLLQSLNETQTYLGRPWRAYSRTIVMQSYLSEVIHPEGWLRWNATAPINNLFYAEYSNFGLGSRVSGRVAWPSFHIINSSDQAKPFTVSRFIGGDSWLPGTGVVYTPGLEV